jgi:hypothetical protein
MRHTTMISHLIRSRARPLPPVLDPAKAATDPRLPALDLTSRRGGGCSEGEGSPHSSSARFRTRPTHRTTSPATSSRATSWLAARAAPGRPETWRETPPLASLLFVQLSGSSLRRRRGGEVGRRGVAALGFGAPPESPLSERRGGRFDTTF